MNEYSPFKLEKSITAKFKDGHIEDVYIDGDGKYYTLEIISPSLCTHKYIDKEDFEQVEIIFDETGIIEYRPVSKGE